MSAFADTSALVKLYANDAGRDIVTGIPVLIIAQTARVEVPDAIWKKHRMGELSQEDATCLVREFEADYHGTTDAPPRFVAVPTTAVVFERAARMARIHGLAGFRSVQLASAVLAAEADPESRTFVCFDRRLRSAALAEGFPLIPD